MNFKTMYCLTLCAFLMACNGGAPASKTAKETNTTKPAKKSEAEPSKDIVISSVEFVGEPKEESANDGKVDTVSVSNVEDLVQNAKSNTVMYLEKGTYALESDLVYFMTKEERKIIDKRKVETRSIGGQLFFSGLENFQLIGKKGSQIVSKNPQAVAFFVVQGKNLKFSNLTIKKDAPGKADLAYVSNSNNVEMDRCKFDGGGTYGIYVNNMDNMKVKNSTISGCTSGAVRLNNSRNVEFINSTFTNNIGTTPIFNFYGTGSQATLNNVKIINNKRNPSTSFAGSDRILGVGSNVLKLENCTIQNNEGYKFLGVNAGSVNKSQIDGVSMQ